MSNRYAYGLKQDYDMFARIPQDYAFMMSGNKDYHCFYIYRRKLSKEELKSSGLVDMNK